MLGRKGAPACSSCCRSPKASRWPRSAVRRGLSASRCESWTCGVGTGCPSWRSGSSPRPRGGGERAGWRANPSADELLRDGDVLLILGLDAELARFVALE